MDSGSRFTGRGSSCGETGPLPCISACDIQGLPGHHQARPENKADPTLIVRDEMLGSVPSSCRARVVIRILVQVLILAFPGIWRPHAVRDDDQRWDRELDNRGWIVETYAEP
jgi:hypothetical protein